MKKKINITFGRCINFEVINTCPLTKLQCAAIQKREGFNITDFIMQDFKMKNIDDVYYHTWNILNKL